MGAMAKGHNIRPVAGAFELREAQSDDITIVASEPSDMAPNHQVFALFFISNS
jgi:hypothetical protein